VAVQDSAENDRLLQAARAGDAAAFGRLVEGYRPYLKTVAERILGGYLPSDGSDVVQTSFTGAFQKLGQFQNGESAAFLGWLAEIVRNEARKALRKRVGPHPLPDGAAGEMVGSSSGPDRKAWRREQSAQLLAAIDRLPADYQAVIKLRHWEELPFEEVAQRLGRTNAAAVRQLWTRAIKRLRQELGEES
jgi:RNA polymerase sigma-70 factor (ECF subfamily)